MRLSNLDLRPISLLCATFEITILYHNYILFYMHQK